MTTSWRCRRAPRSCAWAPPCTGRRLQEKGRGGLTCRKSWRSAIRGTVRSCTSASPMSATRTKRRSPPTSPRPRPTTVLRSVRGGNGRSDVRVHLVIPKSFNDAQQVADKFKDQIPVVLNLQGVETDLSKRLIDFASGLTYALDGGMQRIADKVFMLTPRNVQISAEERAQLIEKGFFNQS